jgi:DNA-directed RNA polymerase I subunit RPA1
VNNLNFQLIESSCNRFYADEDVRARSVCEVTSSVAVDTLGTAIPNGVYDPRMGPTKADNPPCTTCALRFLACPGHFGHIELCVPLYHPLLFGKMIEFLRIKCLNCHQLKISKRSMKVYKMKFRLLNNGRYIEALELDNRMAAAMKKTSSKSNDSKGALSIHSAGLALDAMLDETTESLATTPRNGHSLSSLEEAKLRDLVKETMSDCKSHKNCPHCGAFSPRIRQDSSNKVFQAALSASAKRMNDAEGISIQPALAKRNIDGYEMQSDDEGEKDSTMETEDGNTAKHSSRDNYMHAAEVKAQVQRTWATCPEICEALFAVQGYDVFFMQAVPVPPNRFRPPMHLGGMVVEHGQNQYLNKMLQSNELVRSNFASNNEALAYKFWIDLQTHLNCYMDSSKDPSLNQNAAPGIRQLLERKEGMFRKHMMGKRVNYCCRSVISPDPYIGTNEIGIPRYFVETLTYPTPVTDINIEELRNLVERGPYNYPGARWVEFPDRRVDLSKMDGHQREAVAARLLMYAKKGGKPAIVGRQMRDGDMVLMNRQVRFPLMSSSLSIESNDEDIVMHHSERVHVRL